MIIKPLAIDLFCGLGGWTEGLLAEGFNVVGFDIERHQYGEHRYPAQMVVQDVLTLHGSQFKSASLIVASPPCQEYSYMAMPWKLAKTKAAAIRADITGQALADLNRLFDACFRIQKEASIAAGRHIPMVVENVRGAIPWVGRSRWNFGSFHLWGDVPALMPWTQGRILKAGVVDGRLDGATNFHRDKCNGGRGRTLVEHTGFKTTGMNWSDRSKRGQDFTPSPESRSLKLQKASRAPRDTSAITQPDTSSNSSARKMASAMIAKIPLPLSRHIAATYRP